MRSLIRAVGRTLAAVGVLLVLLAALQAGSATRGAAWASPPPAPETGPEIVTVGVYVQNVQAVDLGSLGIGLTQQIVGPLVFSGGIGFNVSPSSPFYGDVTASYVELRWQRRAYEVGLFYSPYQGIGGVRVKLNDFNFKGPGVPFVPLNPAAAVLDRPF